MSRQEQLAGVNEGDVLAGKYRVDKVLGIGGMGVVVAAHHIHLDDRVAIKFLLPETLGNAEAVMRFAREARAAVKIKSEHVARVTDVGTLESGAPYMVMEYLEGADLSGWVSERGPLPVERAVDFLLQACEAIAEAHALGIVHRDLKLLVEMMKSALCLVLGSLTVVDSFTGRSRHSERRGERLRHGWELGSGSGPVNRSERSEP